MIAKWRIRDVIRLHAEFDTEAAAELWRDGMYRAYNPAGYSTWIRIEKETHVVNGVTGELWIAWGWRAESCD